MKRNLLYHLYPARGSVWRWHVDRLLEHRAAWNGRAIVVAALGPGTDPKESVESALAPLKVEVLWRENDPVLAEAKWFLDSLALLESADPEEATFYAHAKGSSKALGYRKLPSILSWSRAMYVLGLSRPDQIEKLLRLYPAVGCFRQARYFFGAPWHFSGTFFWLRHDALFSRAWRALGDGGGYHGVEAFPGTHFLFGESYCLTDDNVPIHRLYNSPRATSDSSIERWRRSLLENF